VHHTGLQYKVFLVFIFKRNTPQLAEVGIKSIRIQLVLVSA